MVECSICFFPDGSKLASGSGDNSIRLWDVKTGQQKAKLHGHSNSVYSVCFSPNGSKLASGSGDNSIRLWDVKTGQQKSKLDGQSDHAPSIFFSPESFTLASGNNDKLIRLWDVKTGREIPTKDDCHQIMRQCINQQQVNTCLQQYYPTNLTVLRIAQSLEFQAQQTLILKGEFINYQGISLKPLLKSKGGTKAGGLFNKQ